MPETTIIKDPSVMDKKPSVVDKNTISTKLQTIRNGLLLAFLHPQEAYKNHISTKLQTIRKDLSSAFLHPCETYRLGRKEHGIKIIMEEINMTEDHFGRNQDSFKDNRLEEFYNHFRINYCTKYKKTKDDEEEEKLKIEVIKNFQKRISIIRDKIFQDPQKYLAVHQSTFNPVVGWGNYDKLIKETFNDFLIELKAEGKSKDDILRELCWDLRYGFNAVLRKYYKPGTYAYSKMAKKIKAGENQ